jgi:hypothetical protein
VVVRVVAALTVVVLAGACSDSNDSEPDPDPLRIDGPAEVDPSFEPGG